MRCPRKSVEAPKSRDLKFRQLWHIPFNLAVGLCSVPPCHDLIDVALWSTAQGGILRTGRMHQVLQLATKSAFNKLATNFGQTCSVVD